MTQKIRRDRDENEWVSEWVRRGTRWRRRRGSQWGLIPRSGLETFLCCRLWRWGGYLILFLFFFISKQKFGGGKKSTRYVFIIFINVRRGKTFFNWIITRVIFLLSGQTHMCMYYVMCSSSIFSPLSNRFFPGFIPPSHLFFCCPMQWMHPIVVIIIIIQMPSQPAL